MVDLAGQYAKIKNEIDLAIQNVLDSTQFINGPIVSQFEKNLAQYLNVKYVISCANGTDALLVSLMALGLKKGDEVIVPAFTYVATAEVIALLGLIPIMVDVDPQTFNINLQKIEHLVTEKTKAIIPVHLYGQCSDIESLVAFAKNKNISVVEDNAQSLGSICTLSSGEKRQAGTIGDIGTTSFFPSKNLGCYGDGGAIFTNNSKLAAKIRMICNHGQVKKYIHSVVGVNSRLDSIQAAVLNVKLNYFDNYISARNLIADNYDGAFKEIEEIVTPFRQKNSSHTFHQYTIKVPSKKRNLLKDFLANHGISSAIYYPIPLYKQEAYQNPNKSEYRLNNTEVLCETVLSLPIHTEMDTQTQQVISNSVKSFFQ